MLFSLIIPMLCTALFRLMRR